MALFLNWRLIEKEAYGKYLLTEKFNNLTECKKLQATVRKTVWRTVQENGNKSEKLLEHGIIKTPGNGI
jgi:hypothetical protein